MPPATTLERHIEEIGSNDPILAAAGEAVLAIAAAGRHIAVLVAAGPLAGPLAAVRIDSVRGDIQKELDLKTNDLLLTVLREAPVAAVGSEELEDAELLDVTAPVAVAIDPLDGSSNIDTNAPIGTVFSILPTAGFEHDPAAALLQPGRAQLAAGFLLYGPQTSLIVSFGRGTQLFTLDWGRDAYVSTGEMLEIPAETKEYAINGSNYRHWEEPIRRYVDDCVSGAAGPRGDNYNTRWIASMVAEAYRILVRGGIYLYPADQRSSYVEGRLRLIYEANPIAFLVEQAGGRATDGQRRILDIEPKGLHQRVPLVFGSRREVEHVARYYDQPDGRGERSPLFSHSTVFGASQSVRRSGGSHVG